MILHIQTHTHTHTPLPWSPEHRHQSHFQVHSKQSNQCAFQLCKAPATAAFARACRISPLVHCIYLYVHMCMYEVQLDIFLHANGHKPYQYREFWALMMTPALAHPLLISSMAIAYARVSIPAPPCMYVCICALVYA
jgi:hypothetical protein